VIEILWLSVFKSSKKPFLKKKALAERKGLEYLFPGIGTLGSNTSPQNEGT